MGRFIFFFILFLIAGGLLLHFGYNQLFFLKWIGKLPVDFVVRKGKIIIYFPIVSSAILSLIICFILSLFKRK